MRANDLEEMKKQVEAEKYYLKIMAATGDISCDYVLHITDLNERMQDIAISNLSKEQFTDLINMTKQFRKILDDYVKDNNIKVKEVW